MMIQDDAREHQLARAALRAATPGPCPGDDAVVAWVEGRVAGAAGARMEAHLAACGTCRAEAEALADVLRAEPVTTTATGPRYRWRQGAAVLLAASVLVALALAWPRSPPGGEAPALDLASLQRAARDVAARMPEAWRDFTPLTDEELQGGMAVERGGLTGLRPGGTIDTTRPTLRWHGEGAARVRVLDEEGRVRLTLEASGAECPWPASAPALDRGLGYVLTVEVQRPDGAARGSRAFRVASAKDDETFAAAQDVLATVPTPALAALLRAHHALRAERHEAAREAAEAAEAAGAGEPARAVQRRALALLGEPDTTPAAAATR